MTSVSSSISLATLAGAITSLWETALQQTPMGWHLCGPLAWSLSEHHFLEDLPSFPHPPPPMTSRHWVFTPEHQIFFFPQHR
ncbi:rCG51562 [Rattus norvegicus]|uniref:RCG51562 n=1 Tax=Rattus norvegicus TaxID=10116 RepID=A6IZ49_RAT|nr:rCG51562 [Rattus norvegicus]